MFDLKLWRVGTLLASTFSDLLSNAWDKSQPMLNSIRFNIVDCNHIIIDEFWNCKLVVATLCLLGRMKT